MKEKISLFLGNFIPPHSEAARSVGRRAHIAQGHFEVRAKRACLPPAVRVYWRHRPP